MNKQGQAFFIEAIISMLILLLIVSVVLSETNEKEKEVLYIKTLENDLIKTHILTKDFELESFEKSFKFIFSQKNGFVSINGNKKMIGIKKGFSITSSALIQEKEIIIGVYLN